MKKFIFLCALLFVFCFFSSVHAAEMYGSKATGMGGAFTAVADDLSALYWNPAGLAQLDSISAVYSEALSTTSLYDSFEFYEFWNIGELLGGTGMEHMKDYYHARGTALMGGNVKNIAIALTGIDDRFIDLRNAPIRTDFSELSFNVASGSVLLRDQLFLHELALGFNARYISHSFSISEYKNEEFYYDPNQEWGEQSMGITFGVLAKMNERWNTALVVKDIRLVPDPSDIPAAMHTGVGPLSLTVGTAYKPARFIDVVAVDFEHLFSTKDLVGNEEKPYNVLHMGAEKCFHFNLLHLPAQLALRFGAFMPLQKVENNMNGQPALTSGIGLDWKYVTIEHTMGISKDNKHLMWNYRLHF